MVERTNKRSPITPDAEKLLRGSSEATVVISVKRINKPQLTGATRQEKVSQLKEAGLKDLADVTEV